MSKIKNGVQLFIAVCASNKNLTDRQDNLESEQKGLKEQIGQIREQLEEIKSKSTVIQPTVTVQNQRSFFEALQKSSYQSRAGLGKNEVGTVWWC